MIKLLNLYKDIRTGSIFRIDMLQNEKVYFTCVHTNGKSEKAFCSIVDFEAWIHTAAPEVLLEM